MSRPAIAAVPKPAERSWHERISPRASRAIQALLDEAARRRSEDTIRVELTPRVSGRLDVRVVPPPLHFPEGA